MKNSKKDAVIEALYSEQFQKCVAFISKRFGKFLNNQVCEDIVQDSIIDLWKRYSDKPIKELEKLLLTIACNKATSLVKKQEKYLFSEWDEKYMVEMETADAYEEDGYNMDYLRKAERFDRELENLGASDRQLMLMCMCMEKIPAKEMAQRLGYKSVQAVRNRKSVILKK